MVTLSKRATPSQKRVLRAVEGAVKNASDAHPDWKLSPAVARSIAKRAAGTLTAQWPDVLAARSALSDRADGDTWCISRPQLSDTRSKAGRGPSYRPRRSPLQKLWKEIAMEMRKAKDIGPPGRAEALIEVLRRIAAIQRNLGQHDK